jgi:hypothetical protein
MVAMSVWHRLQPGWGARAGLILLLWVAWVPTHSAVARDGEAFVSATTQSVAIIMEEAPARGKVVVLEDADSDRGAVSELHIELWDNDKSDKLFETETDDLGLFDMPRQVPGDYVLVVGRLHLLFKVLPRTEPGAGGETPKAILILVPKDVI